MIGVVDFSFANFLTPAFHLAFGNDSYRGTKNCTKTGEKNGKCLTSNWNTIAGSEAVITAQVGRGLTFWRYNYFLKWPAIWSMKSDS